MRFISSLLGAMAGHAITQMRGPGENEQAGVLRRNPLETCAMMRLLHLHTSKVPE